MPAASRRQKQGNPEFLGQAENLSQEGMHLRLPGLIIRVIPSSPHRPWEKERHPVELVGAEVEKVETLCTNSCRVALPRIITRAVPRDPAIQLLGIDWKD